MTDRLFYIAFQSYGIYYQGREPFKENIYINTPNQCARRLHYRENMIIWTLPSKLNCEIFDQHPEAGNCKFPKTAKCSFRVWTPDLLAVREESEVQTTWCCSAGTACSGLRPATYKSPEDLEMVAVHYICTTRALSQPRPSYRK